MDFEALENQVRAEIEPILEQHDAELVGLKCRHVSGRLNIQCFVDCTGGIGSALLGELNRAIGGHLEEQTFLDQAYVVEVSSPGLDWPLKTQRDFSRVLGRLVRVRTSDEAQNEYLGEVVSSEEETVVLRLESEEERAIPLSSIVKAQQEIQI